MKTILDKTTRDELIRRINTLNENNTAQWGKMNVYQMLKHCVLYEEMVQGKKKHRRIFLGRLFGKMALNDLIKDEKPVRHNMPTIPAIKVKENEGDIAAEKAKWIAMIEEYTHRSNQYGEHAFFGKMTEDQIGLLEYKHIDHHLRQFNS
jgi:hypothetical protein